MGAWHIDINTLKKVLTKPIKTKDGIDKLGEGLGDDQFYDYLGVLEDTLPKDTIINDRVIKWLNEPENSYNEQWLDDADVDEIKANKVTDKYEEPSSSPSLLENIENAIKKGVA